MHEKASSKDIDVSACRPCVDREVLGDARVVEDPAWRAQDVVEDSECEAGVDAPVRGEDLVAQDGEMVGCDPGVERSRVQGE